MDGLIALNQFAWNIFSDIVKNFPVVLTEFNFKGSIADKVFKFHIKAYYNSYPYSFDINLDFKKSPQ